MKALFIIIWLLVGDAANAQQPDTIDYSNEPNFAEMKPRQINAFFSILLKDVLDPLRHLSRAERKKYEIPGDDGYIDREELPDRPEEMMLRCIDLATAENPSGSYILKDRSLEWFRFDGLLIKKYTLNGGEGGRMTEMFNAQNQLVLFYRSGLQFSDIEDWKGLSEAQHSVYFSDEPHSLYAFDYSSQGRLRKTVQYFSESPSFENQAAFQNITAQQLPAPQSLSDGTEWSAPAISAKDDPRLNIQATDCNHGHICCDVGCPCCNADGRIRPQILPAAGAAGKPQYTKQLKDNGRLDVFLDEAAALQNPRYEFTNKYGQKNLYYSTLSPEGLLSAARGGSALNEYDEKGEAWVIKADGQTFCKIDKQGQEVPIVLDAEWLETGDIPNIQLGDDLFAVEFDLHGHLPGITDEAQQPIKLTGMVNRKGQVQPNSLLPGTVRRITGQSILVGQYDSAPFSIEEGFTGPSLSYYVCNLNFEKLSPRAYQEVNGYWGEGLSCVKANGRYGFIDTLGREVIPCVYEKESAFYTNLREHNFLNGKTIVWINGRCGVIDTRGNTVIPFEYEYFAGFSEGLCAVRQNGLNGYIDTTGRIAIPCIYVSANYFSGGKALVQQKDAAGLNQSFYINTKGQRLPEIVR